MITVNDCLKLPVFSNSTVVAGSSGLNRFVSTVSTIEICDDIEKVSNLIRGHELIVTALASIRDNVEKQYLLIRSLAESSAAGIVLFYLGSYFNELPKEALDIANELSLPIIIIPPEEVNITYADVISSVMEIIIKNQISDSVLREMENNYISAVLQGNEYQAAFLAKKLYLNIDKICGMCIFENVPYEYCSTISHQFYEMGVGCVFSVIEKRIVFLLYISSQKNIVLDNFYEKFRLLFSDLNITEAFTFFSVDTSGIYSFDNLYKNYCEVNEYLRIVFPHKKVFTHYDITFVRNCLDIIHHNCKYYDNKLNFYTLLDNSYENELMQTLSIYLLDAGMNALETSKLLFVHNNTIQYRLRKIKELLNISLSDVSEISIISTSLAIKRILEGSDNFNTSSTLETQ